MRDIELKLTADLDSATKNVGGFRKEYAEMVRAVEKPLRQINSFRELESTLEKTGRGITTARDAVRALGDQMAATISPTRQLQSEYRDSVNQLKVLERQEQSQTTQLGRMRKELQAAGVDTRNLSGEQRRLQSDLSQKLVVGQRDKGIQDAQVNLGIAKFSSTSAEIARLQSDFQLLRSTGKLSGTEIAIAQNTLRQSLAAASAQTAELTGATKIWNTSLSDVRGQILAGAVAFGGFALAASKGFSTYADFEQQIAAIGTITDLSDKQLSGLSQGIRGLSLDMGKSAKESASAVYDLLGSGVATADAMKVLEQSTKAAVAGMSDTKTAAGVGVSIINAYGESMDNLGLRYDQLFVAIKDGVVSFDQLAAGLGQVLPTAAAAGVSFSEVGAAIARMTVQGIQAPIAITALRSAINQLASPAVEARKAMGKLGIEWKGLSATLEQIASKKLGFDALAQIIPETEGRTAILALTKDYAGFVNQVKDMEAAGGTTERAYEKMSKTPQAQVEKFNAALEDLNISFGKAIAAGLPLVALARDIINAFNGLNDNLKTGILSFVAFGVGAKAVGAALSAARLAFTVLSGGTAVAAAQLGLAGTAMDSTAAKATKLNGVLNSTAGGIVRGGLYGILISQLSQLYGMYQEMEEFNRVQKETEKGISDLIAKNVQYKDTIISQPAVIQAMTEAERKSYVERLRNAQTYYSKLAEQISRADAEKNGGSGPVDPDALAAARKAREYGKALEQETSYEKERVAAAEANSKELVTIQTNLQTDLKTQLDKQVAAERTALAAVKKAKKDQLDTQKKYAAAIADLNSSGDKEASYGAAQDLKVSAQQSLRAGDTTAAKKKADDALKMLQSLAQSGENTYGFEGFMKELQSIETAADKINLDKAEDSFKTATDKVKALKAEIADLKVITITPQLSEEALAKVKKQLRDLQLSLGQQPSPELGVATGTNLANDLVKKVSSTTSTDQTATPVTAVQPKKLSYVPGKDSYSQDELGVKVQPVVAPGAPASIEDQIDDQGDIPVEVDPVAPADSTDDLDVPVQTELDQSSVSETQAAVSVMAEDLRKRLTVPVSVVATSSGDLASNTSSDSTVPGFASGDMVRGPGTGTSDSILARLSNGEFVVRAAAVRHYGTDLLRSINQRSLPGFAVGGEVGARLAPSVSAPSQALLDMANPQASESLGSFTLNMGGETYQLQAPQQDFQRLIRNQRIKYGKS
ncbi:phage tail tape measure protein [Pseudomonas baltica]|uniref:phage tail tape measure protein n=1 Tax=Pseudomonas baltica TaxID=2762576 RepID=UPI00289E553D|nr:phage tail tape measure protein [Pseudomonas baltica]